MTRVSGVPSLTIVLVFFLILVLASAFAVWRGKG